MDTKGISTRVIIIIAIALIVIGLAFIFLPQNTSTPPEDSSKPGQNVTPEPQPKNNKTTGDTEIVSEINVSVIGVPSIGVTQTLNSADAKEFGITSPITLPYSSALEPDNLAEEQAIDIAPSLYPPPVSKEELAKFAVVILQGDPYYTTKVRDSVKDYVDSGGKLIVVGDAGSHHPEYGNVAGWAWPSGQGIPVPAKLLGSEMGVSETTYGNELRMVDINHPIVTDLQIVGSSLRGTAEVFKVSSKGSPIVAINTNEGYMVAVIEGNVGIGGKVIYFAYDPGMSPEILLTTIRYLAGV